MEAELTVVLPLVRPKKNEFDRSSDEDRAYSRRLNIKFDGDLEIYSKILKKLEEMANGNGWSLN